MDAIDEQRLWQAVIVQAITDACAPPLDMPPRDMPEGWTPTRSKRDPQTAWAAYRNNAMAKFQERERERDTARSWLTNDTEGFRVVCDAAGLNPDHIRSATDQVVANGWQPLRHPEDVIYDG